MRSRNCAQRVGYGIWLSCVLSLDLSQAQLDGCYLTPGHCLVDCDWSFILNAPLWRCKVLRCFTQLPPFASPRPSQVVELEEPPMVGSGFVAAVRMGYIGYIGTVVMVNSNTNTNPPPQQRLFWRAFFFALRHVLCNWLLVFHPKLGVVTHSSKSSKIIYHCWVIIYNCWIWF